MPVTTEIPIQMRKFSSDELLRSLKEQAERLINFGYPRAMEMTEDVFLAHILKTAGSRIPLFLEVPEDTFPSLLVIPNKALPFKIQLELLGIKSERDESIWNIGGIATPNHPFLTFGVKYLKSMNDVPLELSIARFWSSRWQVLVLTEGLAMIAQFDELFQHCDGLICAGSYWYIKQVKYAPEYSCLDGEKKIIGREVQASCCGSYFGLCEKEPTFVP